MAVSYEVQKECGWLRSGASVGDDNKKGCGQGGVWLVGCGEA